VLVKAALSQPAGCPEQDRVSLACCGGSDLADEAGMSIVTWPPVALVCQSSALCVQFGEEPTRPGSGVAVVETGEPGCEPRYDIAALTADIDARADLALAVSDTFDVAEIEMKAT
jgi:hypothetical protein